jgi:hypothetical protein
MFNYMPDEALLGFVQMFEQSSLMHSNFPGKNAGIDFSRMIKIAAIVRLQEYFLLLSGSSDEPTMLTGAPFKNYRYSLTWKRFKY